MSRPIFALFCVLAATGCQSEAAAYRVICDAPITCPECMQGPPDSRQSRIAQHIDERLSNRKVKEAFRALAAADPATRQSTVVERAKELGVVPCPLLDPIEIKLTEPITLPTKNEAPAAP